MTAPKTVQYFGYYLYIVASTLVFVPNLLANILQIPETNEPWIRVVDAVAAMWTMSTLRKD